MECIRQYSSTSFRSPRQIIVIFWRSTGNRASNLGLLFMKKINIVPQLPVTGTIPVSETQSHALTAPGLTLYQENANPPGFLSPNPEIYRADEDSGSYQISGYPYLYTWIYTVEYGGG